MSSPLLTIDSAYKCIFYLAIPENYHQATIAKVTGVKSPELATQIKGILDNLDRLTQSDLSAIDDPNFGLVQADVLKWQPNAKSSKIVELQERYVAILRQLVDPRASLGMNVRSSPSVSVPVQISL